MSVRAEYREGCKRCSVCCDFKPPDKFRQDKARWDGRVGRCYECERSTARARRKANPEKFREIDRRYAVKFRYGMTVEEYEAALSNGCSVCGATQDETRLVMDHDHTSGLVRAALCSPCNTGLGMFADDPKRLRAAADYLQSHNLPINT